MDKRSKVMTIAVIAMLLVVVVAGAILLNQIGVGKKYTNVSSLRLQVLGNANEDDVIDQRDVDYIRDVISGKEIKTNLSDANHDGVVDSGDVDQVNKIINDEASELYYIDCDFKTAKVNLPVNRIITAYSNWAEMVRVLGATDRVIAVDDHILGYPTYLPEFASLPSVGTRFAFNVETILSLDPDIVLTGSATRCTPGLESMLSANATDIDVVRLPSYEYNLVSSGILTLGYILGAQEEAYEYIAWHDSIVDKVTNALRSANMNDRPSVFMDRPGSTTVAKGSGYSEVLEMAGGINIGKDLVGNFPTVDLEWVIEQNPEHIIGISFSGSYESNSMSLLTTRYDEIVENFGYTDAVKEGNVHVLHYDIYLGVSYVVGLAYTAKWLYPNLTGNIDPPAIHQEYIDKFCGGLDYDISEQGVFVL